MQATMVRRTPRTETTDDERWQAVASRDSKLDGAFLFAVRTTGVYCRPTCPARRGLRRNVCFFATCQEAEAAGFRPCKRCRPKDESPAQRQAVIVAQACRMIEQSDRVLSLGELADTAGLSAYHFHRLFKTHTGVTPKAYATAHRSQRVRHELATRCTVTQAVYNAGFHSSGRFYESAAGILGMAPKTFRAGGKDTSIRFAVGECWLGTILVAASDQGICAILLGDDAEALVQDLQKRFPQAKLTAGTAAFEQHIAKVVRFVEAPAIGLDLPLDIRGTAFQHRVWEALRKVPAGKTVTYAEIAKRIGRPKAVRAVGQAIGANPLAVAIPCHRVIRTGGAVCGYHWGVARKIALQQREKRAHSS